MNVLVFTIVFDFRKIEVDDMHDVADIQTSTRDTSGDQDRAFAIPESSTVTELACEAKRRPLSLTSSPPAQVGYDLSGLMLRASPDCK